jgi:diguanylate cyclase (GGDEF)-like protein
MFTRWLARILLSIAALTPAAAAAQITLPACVVGDASGVTLTRVAAGEAPVDCATPQHRFGAGDFWVVSPLPKDAPANANVRVASLMQDALTLHIVYADGAIARIATTSRTIPRHLQLGAIVEFAIPVRAAPPRQLVWHVRGAANVRGILLNATLVSPATSAALNVRMAALYSGFAGLAFALLVYHLALWGVMRHRFQIAYCAMVVTLLVYAASSSGALAWFWPTIDNNRRLALNYILLGLAAASALAFARSFFEPKVFEGWLGPATTSASVLLASSGMVVIALSFIDVVLADRVYAWILLGSLSVALPILWRAWRRRSNYLWLFAAAWAAPIAFAFGRIISAMHWVPGGFWLDNSTVLSMALEALMSSIAISYRLRLISHERDEAVQNEIIARRLADTDMLTGLPNRRAFLSQAIGRTGGHILHVVDVDHFKLVNETLGHDGGDEVLRQVAKVLRHAAPPAALVARIGGEEFAIVTPIAEPLDPDRLLAKLRSARMPFDVVVTASIGTCVGPLATDVDWKHLYQAADRALFAAKAGGRDRVRAAPALALAA